ncbi:MAG: tRNA (adenine-N1)-methyltransferase [Anaerolineales bacterium]|nr:tRNA (adenine-N1)-methyltransferase [Anaerolineales bacterium]
MPPLDKTSKPTAQAGDLIQLITEKQRHFIFTLKPGATFQSHNGIISHDDLIGLPWGSRVKSHMGKFFALLQPQLDDLLRDIPRRTQIMYPKEIGYVLISLGVGPGSVVLEAGTGSGALTTALAYMVGDDGLVLTYERNPDHAKTAQENLTRYGMAHRVKFHQQDLADGIEAQNVQAAFLDLPDPENYIKIVRPALIPGGILGCFLPTTNQVSTLITALKQNNFENIEVSEILHRYYNPSATRLRPSDKMVGHTGFLIFTRKYALYSESDLQPNT